MEEFGNVAFEHADRSWQAEASCRESDPELFFPQRDNDTASKAKKVCRGCEVQGECLDYAIANGEKFGIWGGYTERERRRIGRARALAGQQAINGASVGT